MIEDRTNNSEQLINTTIEAADELCGQPSQGSPNGKPRLLMENWNPDKTVADLRDILAGTGQLYNRGVPVRIARDHIQKCAVAQVMTPDGLVLFAHEVCRPYIQKNKDEELVDHDACLSRSVANMYLEWQGEWNLPVLNGISSTPLLQEDGTISFAEGYDHNSGMWIENLPDFTGLVPERPTKEDALKALRLVRDTFKTFCFADADTLDSPNGSVAVVDIDRPPGKDETAFLNAILTAVCRPSLHLAPGVLLRAAPMSGAGAGKGLLARCMSIIAFGREPHAVTGGTTVEELEKRIAAELIEGGPVLFLDNLNKRGFKSALLASAMTERPARVRVLGRSLMALLNAYAMVILTGNGLTVSEDLARRFLEIELDPRTEAPEARPFTNDIRVEVTERRAELLAALLTIWRWGRLGTNIKPGKALGSFEQWTSWVRDPLLALGCKDPVERISEAKERDGRRQMIGDLYSVWWKKHEDTPVAASALCDEVKQAADPQGHGRQYLVSVLENLTGTRMAGFVLTRQAPPGKWGAATYALKRTTAGPELHRGHRGHTGHDAMEPRTSSSDEPYDPYADEASVTPIVAALVSESPKPPMGPMPPDGITDDDQSSCGLTPGQEVEI